MPGYVFRFGKHAGQSIEDVEADYLEWLRRNNMEQVQAIDEELTRRSALQEANMPMLEKIATAGYKALAQKLHPDKNPGNPEATRQFQDLQAGWAQLQAVLKEVAKIA